MFVLLKALHTHTASCFAQFILNQPPKEGTCYSEPWVGIGTQKADIQDQTSWDCDQQYFWGSGMG